MEYGYHGIKFTLKETLVKKYEDTFKLNVDLPFLELVFRQNFEDKNLEDVTPEMMREATEETMRKTLSFIDVDFEDTFP